MSPLPLLPVTTAGSWPRPPELLRAQRLKQTGRLSAEAFERQADVAVLEVVRLQEKAGVDIVTDGEQRRDNFYSFVAEKLAGTQLMTLLEMLDIVEDKASFERVLQTLDVPAYSMRNPTCIGRIERRQPLAVDELRFLKRHTDKPVKIPLPGPYLLTRAMFVQEVTRQIYPSKEDLAEDVVRVLRDEIAELVAEGVDFIQLDEPVLTELVFTQGQTRTFMCAALATRNDPTEELEFAVALINRVLEGVAEVRTGLHICRGNWSQNESTLLRGSYHPLAAGKELGLGVVNPRTETIESPETISAAIEQALQLYPADRVFLNPDCGFGTFSNRPVNSSEIAYEKLRAIVDAAQAWRARIRLL